MSVLDDLDALERDVSRTSTEKVQAAARLKAAALYAAVSSVPLPHSFADDTLTVTVTRVALSDNQFAVWCAASRAGVPIPLNLPLVFVNPPMLFADPAGDVVRGGTAYRHDLRTLAKRLLVSVIRRAAG